MPSPTAYGCLALVIAPIVVVGGLIVSQGIVRTSEPISEPVSVHQLTLDLRHWSDPIEKQRDDAWLHDVAYSDKARVNGRFSGTGKTNVADFRIQVRSVNDSAPAQLADCQKSAPDAMTSNIDDVCHFVIDLSPNTLRDPIEIKVVGVGAEKRRSFTHTFRFTRQTSYSLAWWEGIMGI